MNELVFKGQNDQVLTNSLLVAEKFEKRHDSVFRAVNQMFEKSPQKCGELFSLATYIDSSGKENQMYIMNRKGFTLLAMGGAGVVKRSLLFFVEQGNKKRATLLLFTLPSLKDLDSQI